MLFSQPIYISIKNELKFKTDIKKVLSNISEMIIIDCWIDYKSSILFQNLVFSEILRDIK